MNRAHLTWKSVRNHPSIAWVPSDTPRLVGSALGVNGRVIAVRVARPLSLCRRDLSVGMSAADIDTEVADEEQPGAHSQHPCTST